MEKSIESDKPTLKWKQKFMYASIVAGVILTGILALTVWQVFFQKPSAPAQFSLEAAVSDVYGIDPKTNFILKTTQPITKNAAKKILKFTPDTEFEVKNISNISGLIPAAFAQSQDQIQKVVTTFEIRPLTPLKENQVYQIAISDSKYADHEYNWAFQVKTPFQVVQVHPRNQAVNIPINSGIEITFNRENIINLESYFEITPKVSGRFEQHGDTAIFIPGEELAAKTIYAVTIKDGLQSQGNEDTLVEDYIFAFETGEKSYNGDNSSFGFQGDFFEFIQDRKPVVGVSYYNMDPNTLDFNLYQFANAEEFLNAYQNSRKWQFGWAVHSRNSGSLFQPSENQKILSFKPNIIKSDYQYFLEIPKELDNGYYLLDTKVGKKREQAWLQITPMSHYFSIAHEKSIVWMYDFLTKKPLEAAPVSFLSEDTKNQTLGPTNQEGLLEFTTPASLQSEQKNYSSPKFLKIEKEGYLPTIIKLQDKWGYRKTVEKGDDFWDYISTDRFTYQMNDTVRYWGVVKGREQDFRQQKVKVGLYDGAYYYGFGWDGGRVNNDTEPLVSQDVLVSQFDTIQGELSFNGVSPGYYNLVVIIGDDVISSTNVEILTYTKPAYQIVVSPSRNVMFAGENVDFQVKANFFDGTPVSGLKLKYNGYWGGGGVNGQLELNEDGEGKLSYTPHYYRDRYGNYWPQDFDITFSPLLSEEGEIWGTGRVLVFGPNIYMQSSQEKQADGSYKFTAKLNDIVINDDVGAADRWRNEYIGGPVAGHALTAKVVKTTHIKIETGQIYDPINKVTHKTYRYDTKEDEIESIRGVTDSKGEWSFAKAFPEDKDSSYRIDFFGLDSKGRDIKSTAYAYDFSYNSWKDFAVSLKLESQLKNNQFSIGEPLELTLDVREGQLPKDAKILFYRYQNNIDKVLISRDLVFKEKFDSSFMPSVQYKAVVLSPYGFEETNSVLASFKEEDNNLSIDIRPEKEKYKPGEQVEIGLLVKDKDDKPISAEVNLSIIDEALFHILPYNWQEKILPSLFRDIYTSLITGASQYTLFSDGAEGGGCFGRGTPILMEDGSILPIEKVKVGDQVLTFFGENERVLKPAIVQGISRHSVDEYLVINNSLEVTPEHKMFVNGDWKYAGDIKIGDTLVGPDGAIQKVHSVVKKDAPDTLVYNIVIGKYHTYFAGGYFVHNAEKGGVRTNFVDVALYETIHTNTSGKASASFKAPDNITSWRVTATAFARDVLKAGQDIKLIKTSLPFFVDASLNDFYLIGDEPIMRLRVFGDDVNRGETTEFSVKSDSLNFDIKENSQDSFVYMKLGKLPEGEHEITVSAKQGGKQDALLKKIKVVKSYFKKAETSDYILSNTLSNIEGNKDGFTKLVFMDAGIGRFYRALWWHNYLDGIRSDQITASFFGKQLLAKHFGEPELSEPLDLSGYHAPDGGISLFPYSDSDLALSAKMADLAPEFVFQSKLKAYFNSALKDKKTDIHRVSKALYGLAGLKEPVLTKINLVKNNQELNLEDKIYIALALAKIGDKESSRYIYANEIRSQLGAYGNQMLLFKEQNQDKRVKLTGMIAILASYLYLDDDADALWDYIDENDPKRDLDVMEETLLIKSELAMSKDKVAKFSFSTNVRSDFVKLEKGGVYKLNLSVDELKTIKFSNIEGKIHLASFYEREKDPGELTRNIELSLSRQYSVGGRQTNSFNEGDVVLVKLDPNVYNSLIKNDVYQVIDYLPSGLKPITRIYETGLSIGCVWYPSKIINNTIYFYWSTPVIPICGDDISYYARVVSKGNYSANPAIIQSLVDLESLNISSVNKIEIK